MRDRELRTRLPAPSPVTEAQLDPDHRLLIRHPDYGPKPK
jgi:hypothetical protein